jgi:N-acetylmuramoyl-L-alanine amidase
MNKITNIPSPNYNERPPGTEIDILVIHYTGMVGLAEALERLCDPISEVSCHYLIDQNGQIFQLISEDKRAWHAGVSSWRDSSNINDHSIGIELENPGHEFGYQKFPESQIDSLIKITKDIIMRHPIPARNIVGHSDIAPVRKKDPGEFFDWNKLALSGIGCWPETPKSADIATINASNFELALKTYGYDITNLPATILAFQRHFIPKHCSDQPSLEMFRMLEILINNLEI